MRSRSGSVLDNRGAAEAQMLIADEELERGSAFICSAQVVVPGEEFGLDSLAPSQAERLADLPAPFQPAMLATLEKQCRDFFR